MSSSFGSLQYLPLSSGHTLAYQQIAATSDRPHILFLGGFMSDMTGAKASDLSSFCESRGIGFTRFDYVGHGVSSGTFTEGTIGLWASNVLSVLDQCTTGKHILVGSSMGGWLMLLTALARKERIAGLIGLAAAPDFTEYLILDQLSDVLKQQLWNEGEIALPSDYCSGSYPITRTLIEEARAHLLLHQPIQIECPVHLLHGMQDDDVPYTVSLQLAEKLTTDDVTLTFIKAGNHRLSEKYDLDLLGSAVEKMLNRV